MDLVISNVISSNDITVDKRTGDAKINVTRLAKECGVDQSSLWKVLNTNDRKPSKLAKLLTEQGFDVMAFNSKGIPIQAAATIVEYYSFDAQRITVEAQTLYRQFARAGAQVWAWHQVGYTPQVNPHLEEIRKQLLLEAPDQWVKVFPDAFYEALMKLHGHKFTGNNSTPSYCAKITRDWVYRVVVPAELLEELDQKQKDEKKHQWFKDGGRMLLIKQIERVTTAARLSSDRRVFEENCRKMFMNQPIADLLT